MRNHFANQEVTRAPYFSGVSGQKFQGREFAGQAALDTSAVPVYTEEAVASLRFMIQEEKLAGDLYESFHEQTGLDIFASIAHAEDRHMDALLAQAERAGIDVSDLTALPEGQFLDDGLQAMYDELLAAGSVSPDAALNAGREIENADIADLAEAMNAVADTPLAGVYERLSAGSAHHLAAFDYWLAA
jgi:hypothetical protein